MEHSCCASFPRELWSSAVPPRVLFCYSPLWSPPEPAQNKHVMTGNLGPQKCHTCYFLLFHSLLPCSLPENKTSLFWERILVFSSANTYNILLFHPLAGSVPEHQVSISLWQILLLSKANSCSTPLFSTLVTSTAYTHTHTQRAWQWILVSMLVSFWAQDKQAVIRIMLLSIAKLCSTL